MAQNGKSQSERLVKLSPNLATQFRTEKKEKKKKEKENILSPIELSILISYQPHQKDLNRVYKQ